jgi:SOS-response transcriptional repressor LexA
MTTLSTEELIARGTVILGELSGMSEAGLSEVFEELFKRADHFRRHRRWPEAENRCRRSLDLAKDRTWSYPRKMNLGYAEGLALMYLGVTYLGQNLLDGATECFKRAAQVFQDDNKSNSAGVAYKALGQVCELRSPADWDNAIRAYQQCLNELPKVTTSHEVKDLRDQACGDLKDAIDKLDSGRSTTGPAIPDAIRVRCFPVAGESAAGIVTMLEQDGQGEYVGLDADHSGSPTYALRIHGDSLIKANIRDSDLVLVREQDWASTGDLALVKTLDHGGSLTLKRYNKESDHLRLDPENDDDPILIVVLDPAKESEVRDKYAGRGGKVDFISDPKKAPIEGKIVAVLRVMG